MKQKFSAVLCFVIIIFISSCNKISEHPDPINGIWECVGYGQQIDINDSLASFYDIYKTGRNLNFKINRIEFDNLFDQRKLASDSLTIKFGINEYDFFRVAPGSNLSQIDLTNSKDPLVNFDALWYTFDANYCSFDIRGVDWKKLREQYRNKLTAKSTEQELYVVLSQMLLQLNDGHVSIDMPESLEHEKEETLDQVDMMKDSVINSLNKKYLRKKVQYNRGIINWGFINKDIAYIQINDFEKLANFDLDPKLSTEQFFLEYEKRAALSPNYVSDIKQGIKKQMDFIFKEVKPAKSCIIDMRFNGGGSDEAALEVVSHFVKRKTNVLLKKVKLDKGFSREQRIVVNPSENYFAGKVFILTSPQTASAAETFVLASMNLPNAVRIGSTTEGIFSDILSKKLPNGWDYGLSNEIYTSNKGVNYEKQGIPADFRIVYAKDGLKFYKSLLQSAETGDLAIETAFKLHNSSK
ncbi:S41 family peptidase [Dyadobacter sp. 3J3]|uniref:S41 family peptidase n=1 Tax=Dyadobacter sp. 3J3 TaxID=2606600 RepID=UPI001356F745|nr:S41 family peptidase [Dyadobacter sp. 3J3]